MSDAESKLILVARLRAEIEAARGAVPPAALRELRAAAERLDLRLTGKLDELPLPELLERCDAAGLELDLTPFDALLRASLLQRIDALRQAAEGWQRPVLDLDAVEPDIRRIPLHPFSWHALIAAWDRLVAALRDCESSHEQVAAASRAFFGERRTLSVPALLPKVSRTLVRRLLEARVVGPAETGSMVADVQAVEGATQALALELQQRARAGEIDEEHTATASDAAFRCLRALASSLDPPEALDLGAAIIQWPGPSFSTLASAWLRPKRGETRAGRLRKANLIYARTGIDPYGAEAQWRRRDARESAAEGRQAAALLRPIARNKTSYGLALMLYAGSFLDPEIEQRWWSLVDRRRRLEAEPAPAPAAAPPAPAPQPVPAAPPVPPRGEAAAPPVPPVPPGGEQEADELELDAEHLVAPAAAPSAEDRLVAEKSSWNVYLKPFLSENWLGLMGVTSLMAAWMFLTMWLWDKGQGYRVGMGIAPLFAITLGAASISRFIQQLEDATPRAASLFSALCVLSVPFGFALGASLLDLGTPVTIALGAGLAVAYALSLPWIGRRVAASFGHDPRRFLLEGDLPIYLPSAALLLAGEETVPVALTASLFLIFAALARGLHLAMGDRDRFRFSSSLFTAVAVLAAAIPHVYYRQVPPAAGLAVLLQAVAWAVSFFGRRSATAMVAAGGASLLGVLVGLAAPRLLPLVLVLAVVFWLDQRRHIRAAWPDEVLALHLLAISLAAAHLTGAGPGLLAFYFVPALAAVRVLERVPCEVLSWALPPFMGAATIGARQAQSDALAAGNLLLLAVAFVLGFRRFSHGHRTGFWLLNLLLFTGLLFAGLGLDADLRLPVLALYLGLAAALWALAAPWLRDPLSVAHRTTVLWLSATAAAVVVLSGVAMVRSSVGTSLLDQPLLLLALALTLFSLALAARRSRSELPVYLALLVTGAAAIVVRGELGLADPGLAAVATATVLLIAAELFDRRQARRRSEAPSADECRLFLFGTTSATTFPGRSERYLARPCEAGAWLLAAVGVVQALAAFAPVVERPGPGVTWFVAAAVIWRLAYLRARRAAAAESAGPRAARSIAGYAALIPAVALAVAATLSLPVAWRGHAALLWIALCQLARSRLAGGGAALAAAVARPVGLAAETATWATIPLGFLYYGVVAASGDLAAGASWVAAAMVFSHFFLVRRGKWPAALSQVVLLHLLAGWTLAFLRLDFGPRGTGLDDLAAAAVFHFAGAFFCLFLPAAAIERWRSPVARAYAAGAQPWLALFALGFVAASVLEPPFRLAPLLAWVLLELGGRHWRSFWMVLAQGGVCLWLGTSVLQGDLPGAFFLGILIFWLLELAARRLESAAGHGLRATPFRVRDPEGERRSVTAVLQLLSLAVLVVHLRLVAGGPADGTVRHFWLYFLIPLALLLGRRLEKRYLGTVGLALFAYANCFYALELLPRVRAFDLTHFHLLSLAFVVSMAGYLAAALVLRRRTSR